MSGPSSLFERACQVMPGGVNSPARAWRAVDGVPPFLVRGDGARVWDDSGTEYIDYVCGWGALLFGHAFPPVVGAVRQAAGAGLTLGMPTRVEVDFAETFLRIVRWAEQVRVTNSGTEAVMTTLRLARAATGRPLILRFEGSYHGHGDGCLPAAPDTRVVPYDDLPSVNAELARHDERIAAIIVEPVAANMGVVPPAPGFLRGLRDLCDRSGALLVFDEVVTGFRLGPAGAAAEVSPDLGIYGKIGGGGAPFGALAGPRRLLSLLAPSGPVFHAGTFAGNALTMAAGLAQLRAIESDPGIYPRLERLGAALEQGLTSLIDRRGYACRVRRAGSFWSIAFCDHPVVASEAARRTDSRRFARFFHTMLAHGVHLAPSPHEVNFLSTAHTEADVSHTLRAAGLALTHAHE